MSCCDKNERQRAEVDAINNVVRYVSISGPGPGSMQSRGTTEDSQ